MTAQEGQKVRPFQQPATGLHLLWQISSLCSYSVSREVRYKLLSSYLHINKNKLQSFTLLKYYVQQQRLLLLKSSASIFQCTCFPLSPLSLFPIWHFQLPCTHFTDAPAPIYTIFPTQCSTCNSFPLSFPIYLPITGSHPTAPCLSW